MRHHELKIYNRSGLTPTSEDLAFLLVEIASRRRKIPYLKPHMWACHRQDLTWDRDVVLESLR
jgi:hypothetical protein